MLSNFFSQWPSYDKEEADTVRDVLLSNKVNYWSGDNGRKFEKEFAEWVNTEYSVTVSNGTVALEFSFALIIFLATVCIFSSILELQLSRFFIDDKSRS